MKSSVQSDHCPLQATMTVQNPELSKASIFQASITSKAWHCSKTINTYSKLLTLWIRALIIPALEAKAQTLTSPGDPELIHCPIQSVYLSIHSQSFRMCSKASFKMFSIIYSPSSHSKSVWISSKSEQIMCSSHYLPYNESRLWFLTTMKDQKNHAVPKITKNLDNKQQIAPRTA